MKAFRLPRRIFASLVLFLVFALAAPLAVERAVALTPDEMLADPNLEARARELSAGLRCLVCQNQSIDDSNAPLAQDLRRVVRERLVAGDTNTQVIDYLVARYGDFVLLRPRLTLGNLALWLTPILVLAAGAGFAIRARRRAPAPQKQLAPEEEEALRDLLAEKGNR